VVIKEGSMIFVVDGPYCGSVGMVSFSERKDPVAGFFPVLFGNTNETAFIPIESLVLVIDVNRTQSTAVKLGGHHYEVYSRK